MKVSIITVCFNSIKTIERTILSVLSQDYPEIQYIIVDGGSTDGTLEVIGKYKDRINGFITGKDQGIYDAINKGIAKTSGEVIGILNADDVYTSKQVITRVVHAFREKGTDSIYGDLEYVSREEEGKVIRYWKSEPFRKELFLQGWMPPHPTFFVKKECYDRFGLFNIDFRISADYELMLRFLYKYGISTAYLPEVLVKMSVGGVSNRTLFSRIQANREDRRAWKINGLKPSSFTLIIKPLSKLQQFIRR